MSVTSEIESLRTVVARFAQDGPEVGADLVAQVRSLSGIAKEQALEELARLCRIAAERIEQNLEGIDVHAKAVVDHFADVIDYAASCAGAIASGTDPSQLVPPPVLALADPEDEKHFLETLGMFVTHAVGSTTELEEDILSIESTEEEQHGEVIGGIRRVIHTLKAEFGVLNLLDAQKLCHETETAIDAITESKVDFPVDLMLEFTDVLKSYLEGLPADANVPLGDVSGLLQKLQNSATEGDQADEEGDEPVAAAADVAVELIVEGEFADSLGEFIAEARSHLSDAEAAMLSFADDADLEHINVTFRAFHTIKGVAGFLNLTPLVGLAHSAETLLDQARSQNLELRHEDVDLILTSGDLISQMIHGLEGQPMPSQARLNELVDLLGVTAARRMETPPVDSEGPADGGDATAKGPSDQEPEGQPVATKEAVLEPQQPAPQAVKAARIAKVERTVKVSTTRLDMLVDMVGELVIAQSMVLQDPTIQRLESESLSRNIGQVSKITRDLQEAAMSLRMVTVKATFQKMARLVRDVAKKSSKKVALTIRGEDTELDRNVVEQISDPLVHMVRNAVDHGIESADDRKAAGKRGEGSLVLRAYHQGGSIVIEIRDDGQGIDKKKIVDKAIERDLLPADTKVEDLPDAEVFGLVFQPGFSTAEEVTDLSGRGVGMDVVRRNIEALRGKIEIESKLGEGTVFRMRLPLTLAIIDGMIVRVGGQRYVVPTLSIEQSFRPSVSEVHYLGDRGECVRVRGAVLPIYRLKQIFCQESGFDDLTEGILIVVEIDGENSCLFVDEILGQQQVVIKGIGVQGERISGVSGGAIMSDGRIALILDVGSLVNAAVAV